MPITWMKRKISSFKFLQKQYTLTNANMEYKVRSKINETFSK